MFKVYLGRYIGRNSNSLISYCEKLHEKSLGLKIRESESIYIGRY